MSTSREIARDALVTLLTAALVDEEATTNEITNPSFEIDTAGWSAWGGVSAIARITTDHIFGIACAQATIDGTIDGAAIRIYTGAGTFAQDDPIAVSAWVKGTAGETVLLQIYERNAGAAFLVYALSELVTFTGKWQKVEHTGVCAHADCDNLSFQWRENNETVTFKFDTVQVEKKAAVTPYCDGTMTGCVWTGAAHASASTRAATTGLPAKTVTGSKVESLSGLTPLVSVLSAGTLRERMTFVGDSATFSFEVQAWVLQSVAGWTNAQAEDALDRIESLITGVYESARGTANWEIVEYAGPTTVLEIAVAGIPYYMERTPTTIKLARS